MQIAANYTRLREKIPDHVTIVLAGKTRSVEEIVEVINAGATDLGENYVQEAKKLYQVIGKQAEWHFIGYLQKTR